MSLTVKLEIYEGPLDLLLHLIKKNEVDVYDIPIALITSQYLEYLQLMESFNIELAGEFLLMAAALIQIKSKMLLPVMEDEEESEDEDPRMALVRPLLEYMKVKEAAETLERRTVLDRDVFARTVPLEESGIELEEDDSVEASLFDLIEAFRRIVTEDSEGFIGLEFKVETKTIKQRILEIVALLRAQKQSSFIDVCRMDRTKAQLILSFLAILELARVGLIKIYQQKTGVDLLVFLVERPFLLETGEEIDGEQLLEKMGLGESWD